jgi:hypothetical protein
MDDDFGGFLALVLVVVTLVTISLYIRGRHIRKLENVAQTLRSIPFERVLDLQVGILEQLYRSPAHGASCVAIATRLGQRPDVVEMLATRLVDSGYARFYYSGLKLTNAGADLLHKKFERQEVVRVDGDYIIAGHGTMISNRSVVANSFNEISHAFDRDVASALAALAEVVDRSGSDEAKENLALFLEELRSERPRKSALKSLFLGIQQAVPTIASMTDVVLKISNIFS